MSIKYHSNILFADNNQLRLGTGSDLRIYHNGSNSFIQDTGTGDLRLMSSHLKLMDTSENLVLGVQAGAVAVTGTLTVGVDDTGHDVKFFGATSGRYMLWDESDNALELTDNTKIKLGDGSDFQFYHSGSNSFITNTVGDINIINHTDNGDIKFQADDGSGGDAVYFTVDGGAELVDFSKGVVLNTGSYLQLKDSITAFFGTGNDLRIWHNGSNSYISQEGTGSLYIRNTKDDQDIYLQSDDGSGGLATYMYLDGVNTMLKIDQNTRVADSKLLAAGSGSDLQLSHDGTNSFIDNITGDLKIRNFADDKDIIFQSDDGSGGVTEYFRLDGGLGYSVSSQHLQVVDGKAVYYGSGNDLGIFHSGTNSFLENITGDLNIINYADDKDIKFQCDDGSGGVETYINIDGSAHATKFLINAVYNDGVKAIFGNDSDAHIKELNGDLIIEHATDDKDIIFRGDDQSGGITTYFRIDGSTGYVKFEDNRRIVVGGGEDMHILHDGTDNYIKGETGDLHIRNDANDKDIVLSSDDGSGNVTPYITLDGSNTRTNVHKNLRFDDNIGAVFGSGAALKLHSDGSNGIIDNFQGILYIRQQVDDQDIVFQCDNGSGGVETYFFLDGSASSGNPYTIFPDNSHLGFGSGYGDLQLHHDGTDSYIKNRSTGRLIIQQDVDDNDIIFNCDDGSGGVTAYLTLDGGLGFTTAQKEIRLEDSVKLRMGVDGDSYIYHTGSAMELYNTTGDITIKQDQNDGDIIFQADDGSGGLAEYFRLNGGFSSPYTNFPDNSTLSFGGSNDLRIYHDGTNNNINSVNGELKIAQYTDDSDIVFYSDDGSGGLAEYFRVDGGDERTIFSKHTKHLDNAFFAVGTGGDFTIDHDGSNTSLQNSTGELRIKNYADDSDIVFQCDDGSGGVTDYIRLDGSTTTTKFNKNTLHEDNVEARFGSDSDFQLYHSGSHGFITNSTGNLTIKNAADDKDILFQCDDGSGGVETYFYLDGSANVDGNPRTKFPDNSRLMFGAGDDMDIFHDGTNSFIRNNSTSGDLIIQQSGADKDIIFKCDDGSGGETAYLTLDGSTKKVEVDVQMGINTPAAYTANASADELVVGSGSGSQGITIYSGDSNSGSIYFADDLDEEGAGDGPAGNRHGVLAYSHNNSEFNLKTGGNQSAVTIAHDGSTFHSGITVGADDTGYDVKFFGATSGRYLLWDESQDRLEFQDNVKAVFGTDADLIIYNDGTNSVIATQNTTGNLIITQNVDDGDLVLKCDDGSGGQTAYLTLDGSTTQTIFAKETVHNDSVKGTFGTGGDLQLYHNGSNSQIDNTTGHLQIRNFADDSDIIFETDDGSGGSTAYLTLDGSQTRTNVHKNLRFDDSVRAEFGSGGDLVITHDGTDSRIENGSVGDLKIQNAADDKDILFRCDDGSGGVTTYFQLDGSAAETVFSKAGRFADNVKARFGSSGDLEIFHNGTDSSINNATGHLYIKNEANDKDIIFQSDDGSGGVEEYFRLDGSASSGSPYTVWPDNSIAAWGTDADLRIEHTGSTASIFNTTGHLQIINYADDSDIIFKSDNGSGGTTAYLTLDGSTKTVDVDVPIEINNQMLLGSKAAYTLPAQGTRMRLLQIADNTLCRIYLETSENAYHQPIVLDIFYRAQFTTSKPQIVRSESYEWHAHSNDVIFTSDQAGTAGADSYIYAEKVAYSTGRPLNIRKIEVFDGTLTVLDGSTTDTNGGTDETIVSTFAELNLGDNDFLSIGDGNDLQLYHTGSDSRIANGVGNLEIINNANDKDIILKSDDGSGGNTAYITLDGSAGYTTVQKHMVFADNASVYLGTGADLQLVHDGSNSTIQNNVGNLTIRQDVDDGDIIFKCDDGSGGVTDYITLDGGLGFTTIQKHVRWQDGVIARFGNSDDGTLYHSGSHYYMGNNTGNIIITNTTDDGDITFNSDDGSGGVTEYFRVDGGLAKVLVSKPSIFYDTIEMASYIYHNGDTNSYFGFSAADTFNLHVGGAEVLRVNGGATTDEAAVSILCGGGTNAENIALLLKGDTNGEALKIKIQNPNNSGTLTGAGILSYEPDADEFNIGQSTTHNNMAISIDNSENVTINKRKFTKTGNTDGTADGDVVYFGGTTSMTTGALYHYKSDGTWELADADSAATCDGLLGVALGAASDTNGVLLRGMVTLDHDPGAVGDVLYVSTTAGDTTATAPSGSGDIVRVIGYCIDASNGQIWFNPDGTFVEVA